MGGLETLISFISELSFWRCKLLKNDGSTGQVGYAHDPKGLNLDLLFQKLKSGAVKVMSGYDFSWIFLISLLKLRSAFPIRGYVRYIKGYARNFQYFSIIIQIYGKSIFTTYAIFSLSFMGYVSKKGWEPTVGLDELWNQWCTWKKVFRAGVFNSNLYEILILKQK